MTESTLESVYRRFADMYANSHPIRQKTELDAAIRAADLGYGEVSEDWLGSLRDGWVYREEDAPFLDDRRNRAYRRLLAETQAPG